MAQPPLSSRILRLRSGSLLTLGAFATLALVGCGGSGSDDSSVQQQIEQARQQGAAVAHRQERIAELQKRVRHLERESGGGESQPESSASRQPAPAPVETSPASTSGAVRTFHAPSGTVSCSILAEGALCAVSSIDETFVFDHGSAAAVEPGAALPRRAGELAPYGSTVSEGGISCVVPQSDEARGIVCTDSSTGHGFEASRVASRQSTY